MRSLVILSLVALMTGTLPAQAMAQDCANDGGNYRVRMQGTVRFPNPGVSDFLAGSIEYPTPVRVRVRPRGGAVNNDWDLCISALDPTLGGVIPIDDVEWRLQGQTNWVPFVLADQLVTSGSGPVDVYLEFRVLLDWAIDTPGDHRGQFMVRAERF